MHLTTRSGCPVVFAVAADLETAAAALAAAADSLAAAFADSGRDFAPGHPNSDLQTAHKQLFAGKAANMDSVVVAPVALDKALAAVADPAMALAEQIQYCRPMGYTNPAQSSFALCLD